MKLFYLLIKPVFLLLLLTHVATITSAQKLNEQDSLRIATLTDSAFNLHSVNFKKAVSLSNKVLKQAQKAYSNTLLINALYTSAYLDWSNGDHKDALSKTYESIKLSMLENNKTKLAENFTLRGLIFLYLSDYDSSLYNFRNGLSYFLSLKDTSEVLKNYGFVGLVYNKQGNYLKAKQNLLEQVVLQRQFNSSNLRIIRFDDAKGKKQYYSESLINAKKNVSKFDNVLEASKEKRFAYRNLGLIYRELGNIDSALFYLKKSDKVAVELNADPIWFDIAKAYNSLGKYDSAFWAARKGIAETKDHGTRVVLSYNYSALGHIYLATNQIDKAILEYKKALSLEKIMLHKNAQMKLMLSIATKKVDNKKFQIALLYADSALVIAKKIGALNDIAKALDIQSRTLEKLGNYRKAFEVKEAYDVLIDSLQKGQVQLELAKLDLFNDVALSKLKISELNKQQALSKANLNNRTLTMAIVFIITAFIVILLVFNYLRTKKLRKFNIELNKQQSVISLQHTKLTKSNREKELLLGEIHHRVKNNLQTITSLLNIQQRKLEDPESIKVLEDSKNRVMAMGLIHEHLYQNASFAEIDFKNYTKQLVGVLIDTNACCEIEVKCSIPDLKIELDNAIFFGLIINELAINSIKHAYDGVDNPLLEISIFESENKIALLVKDNGMKKAIDFDKSNSFGWKMVNNISEKLGGELIIDNSEGLAVKINFSKDIISLA